MCGSEDRVQEGVRAAQEEVVLRTLAYRRNVLAVVVVQQTSVGVRQAGVPRSGVSHQSMMQDITWSTTSALCKECPHRLRAPVVCIGQCTGACASASPSSEASCPSPLATWPLRERSPKQNIARSSQRHNVSTRCLGQRRRSVAVNSIPDMGLHVFRQSAQSVGVLALAHAGDRASTRFSDGGGPGTEALPAGSQDKGLRVGRAT